MNPRNERSETPGEATVRLDALAIRAAVVYDAAVGQARHEPPRRRRTNTGRRWPDEAQRAALIATVRSALAEGLDGRALRSLMSRALTMDPTRPAYAAMRAALATSVPQVGFVCPVCQQTTASGAQARAGWCTHCLKETGGEWYPHPPAPPRRPNSAPAAGREWPYRTREHRQG